MSAVDTERDGTFHTTTSTEEDREEERKGERDGMWRCKKYSRWKLYEAEKGKKGVREGGGYKRHSYTGGIILTIYVSGEAWDLGHLRGGEQSGHKTKMKDLLKGEFVVWEGRKMGRMERNRMIKEKEGGSAIWRVKEK